MTFRRLIEQRRQFVGFPEPRKIGVLGERGEHCGIPFGQFRGTVVEECEPPFLLRGQPLATDGDDGLSIDIDDPDAHESGRFRCFNGRVACEDHVVFVDHDRAGGPNLLQGDRNLVDVLTGMAPGVTGIGLEDVERLGHGCVLLK